MTQTEYTYDGSDSRVLTPQDPHSAVSGVVRTAPDGTTKRTGALMWVDNQAGVPGAPSGPYTGWVFVVADATGQPTLPPDSAVVNQSQYDGVKGQSYKLQIGQNDALDFSGAKPGTADGHIVQVNGVDQKVTGVLDGVAHGDTKGRVEQLTDKDGKHSYQFVDDKNVASALAITDDQYARFAPPPPTPDVPIPATTATNLAIPAGTFLPQAEVKAIKTGVASMTPDQVAAMQQTLKASGLDLGTFGPNKDGIDGKVGKFTTTAMVNYLIKNNEAFKGMKPEDAAKKLAGMKPEEIAAAIQPTQPAPTPAQDKPLNEKDAKAVEPFVGQVNGFLNDPANGKRPDLLNGSALPVDDKGNVTAAGLDTNHDGTLNQTDFGALLAAATAKDPEFDKHMKDAKINIQFDPAHGAESVGNLALAMVKDAKIQQQAAGAAR